MKYCVKLPVNKAMNIVPIPTPTSCFKKHRDKMTAEETNIKSQVVFTFFTVTFKNTDKSLINPSNGISGIDELMNNAAPKLISTQPLKKYITLNTKPAVKGATNTSNKSTKTPKTNAIIKLII